jgi:ribosomal protein S18 acetylase RimI-like enzyme
MNQASEGFFTFMLGKNAEQIIARAFLEPKHSLSYEYVVFVEHDGAIAGMCSAFTGAQHRIFTEEPLKRAAGRSAFRMKCVRTLMSPLWRILDTVPEGDFYLQGMAVEPNLRGAGIGSRLMTDAEERARAGGSARLSLDVSAKNEGARKLYARRGMVESSQWPASRFVPTVFVRMTKDL